MQKGWFSGWVHFVQPAEDMGWSLVWEDACAEEQFAHTGNSWGCAAATDPRVWARLCSEEVTTWPEAYAVLSEPGHCSN